MSSIEKLSKLFTQHGLQHGGISVTNGDTVIRYKVQIDPMQFKGLEKFIALEDAISVVCSLYSMSLSIDPWSLNIKSTIVVVPPLCSMFLSVDVW